MANLKWTKDSQAAYRAAGDVMRAKGGKALREVVDKDVSAVLTFWAVPRGIVITQVFTDTGDVVYLKDVQPEDIGAAPAARLVVVMDGGIVQTYFADGPLEVAVVDYDVEGSDAETVKIPQGDFEGKPQPDQEALASIGAADVLPKDVESIFTVIHNAENECQHADGEDCMNCAGCGKCREDLDSQDLCPDCGGKLEREKYRCEKTYRDAKDALENKRREKIREATKLIDAELAPAPAILIPPAVPVTDWVYTSKCIFPGHGGQVLVSYTINRASGSFVSAARYQGGHWEWESAAANAHRTDDDIYAWKPLPEAAPILA